MFNQIVLSPDLESNFVDVESTREFIRDVVVECHRQNWSQPQDHELIDHQQIENRLERVVNAALKSTNPKSDLSTKVSLGWDLNIVQGSIMFLGTIHIGVNSKNMDRHMRHWSGIVNGLNLIQ
jgi:hypothetical protein